MSFRLDRVHVWSCEVPDKAGGVAHKLSDLAKAGANLEYVGSRRLPDKPGTGVLFIAPVSGQDQVRAAKTAGLHEVTSPVIIRVEGDDESGLAHRLTHEWALAGISFQGLTMSVVGPKFVGYAAFDSSEDANRAATILATVGSAKIVANTDGGGRRILAGATS
jgi:hypothetical protein